MSTPDQVRRKQTELAAKRAAIEKRIGDARRKQSRKNEEAASYRGRAMKSSSASMARSYLRQAESAEKAALAEGRRIADETKKLSDCAKAEAALAKDLATALRQEAAAAERGRKRSEDEARRAHERTVRQERARTASLVAAAEGRLSEQLEKLRPPKTEILRILYLTAAAEGDLRVDKEVRRVRAGVRAATHRDLVQIEHMPAATASDLLDGLARVRPHVLHFSGHGSQQSLLFDTDDPGNNPGHAVSAAVFARAVDAVDEPPLVVVLNSCDSAAQLDNLVQITPIAIGMPTTIGDPDAMSFAARFYTSICEGQSVGSAWEAARVQLQFDGVDEGELPVMSAGAGIDPTQVRLVIPPSTDES